MPVDLERLLARLCADAAAPVGGPRLNVGCGHDRRPGFVNLDLVPLPGVDVASDLGRSFLPFRDETFGLVLCRDVLEHVEVVPALRELHRITAPGGAVVVSAVHFTSRNLYVDPTHVRGYSIRTIDFFTRGGERRWLRDYYFDFAFSAVEYSAIQFGTTLGKGRYFLWDRVVEPLVNCSRTAQDIYEMTFLCRLFPAANAVVVLRK